MASVIASMEACVPALRRYARSLLRDQQEVDDLVHDCLVRALDRRHTRREDGDLRAWLFAIMHNLFITRVRRNKTSGQQVSLEDVNRDGLAMWATQEGHMQTRDLLRALDDLSEEQRSVLLLVSVEDLSYAEVAQALGIPIGTVMSRLSRARERLRQMTEGGAPSALRRVK